MAAPGVRQFHRGGFFQSAAASIERQWAIALQDLLRQPDRPIAKSVFLPSANYPLIACLANFPYSTVASE
jgi:hypothetical protein